jgi:UDP-4-amino-4,6-dideoxy-N-acetyl-beta-L-altrosamine transaminase
VTGFLPYGRQTIDEDDIAAVCEALRGDYLTTGPLVGRFETALARKTGARHAVSCANGTAALYMAAKTLGLGPGSKVIVPAITFLATASAPRLCGADIVFADVDPDSGLMRPRDLAAALERTGGADALFNVHLGGQCGDLEEIHDIAMRHGLKILDDACHAIGADYLARDGSARKIGANDFCDLSVFSFHPVKTITLGEGGAVTANDNDIATLLMRARNHGMTRAPDEFVRHEAAFDAEGGVHPWYYELVEPGFNFRVTDFQCALGISQLAKLERFVARRRELASIYDEALAPLAPRLRPVARQPRCRPAWHLYAVLIDFSACKLSRAEAMKRLAAEGIGTQVHYIPVHRQPYYAKVCSTPSLPGADRYYERTLSLPLFSSMTNGDAMRVADALKTLLST